MVEALAVAWLAVSACFVAAYIVGDVIPWLWRNHLWHWLADRIVPDTTVMPLWLTEGDAEDGILYDPAIWPRAVNPQDW